VSCRSFERPAFTIPILAALGGEFFFRIAGWEWLQAGMRTCIIGTLTLLGEPARIGDAFRYSIGQHVYELTPRCTYADFLCLTTPLIVRWSHPAASLVRAVLWWMGILLFCGFRITTACLLHDRGLPWPLAHDWPDYLFRSVALVVIIFLWLESAEP